MEQEWFLAALRSMVCDVDSLYLVKECRDLEEGFETHFTDKTLCGGIDHIEMRGVKTVRERNLSYHYV